MCVFNVRIIDFKFIVLQQKILSLLDEQANEHEILSLLFYEQEILSLFYEQMILSLFMNRLF